ncbi:hypothetical protein LTR50_005620 [Elasticomyces elasticus]|nr:hypothetical protein LTR50_005620 [Elasticomyces elasticus]
MSNHNSKKRKRTVVIHQPENGVDTSKPTAIFTPKKGRSHTLSIAIPGSIVTNAITFERKTALASSIARASAVFNVDEIVIFNDGQTPEPRTPHTTGSQRAPSSGDTDPNEFLYHVLSYLECPPYLRKPLFPMHENLRLAGTMPSLDMPHHLKPDEWCQYREGVTLGPPDPLQHTKKRSKHSSASAASSSPTATAVDCGLPINPTIPVSLPPNTRVTLKFPTPAPPDYNTERELAADAVSPDTPREEAGYYWGYSTRLAPSLSAVFTECPYGGGYDVGVGTSERGVPLPSFLSSSLHAAQDAPAEFPAEWRHLVLVFGGVAGLEAAFAADRELLDGGVEEVRDVFDYWVNVLPGQGSRTIRTEEAVWIGLMGFRGLVSAREEA